MTERDNLKNERLDRLCEVYLSLPDDDREKIIILGESLLESHRIMEKQKSEITISEDN